VAQFGRNFMKRFEHKAPFRHAWMRNLKIRRLNDEWPVEEYVDVYGPRPFRHQPLSSHLMFDGLNAMQQT
jgi:hypothetical protein